MATLTRELRISDCGNSWCNEYTNCNGHVVRLEYSTVTDIGQVEIDGQLAIIGGDNLLDAVADVIHDLWADKPKYIPKEEQ